MQKQALLIGNSDGIGLATTKRLLDLGWQIKGISRSNSPISHASYRHHLSDVSSEAYHRLIIALVREIEFDLCIYCAGIGELLDPRKMGNEIHIFDVNLIGMVKTAAAIIPKMVEKGKGHFIGISSMADELLSAEAPSYHASKAGFSNYLEGLALALKNKGVHVTNIRFGFVDTKMAKGDTRPLMISIDKAVEHIEHCILKKPVRYSAPKLAVPLIKLRKLLM